MLVLTYPQKLCDYISKTYFRGWGKLLDVGSGDGKYLVGFKRLGYEVYGVDKKNRYGLRMALQANDFKDIEVSNFYQLPFTWERPYLIFIPKILSALVPDCLKWKDYNQTKRRKLILFSKERCLIGVGRKE